MASLNTDCANQSAVTEGLNMPYTFSWMTQDLHLNTYFPWSDKLKMQLEKLQINSWQKAVELYFQNLIWNSDTKVLP